MMFNLKYTFKDGVLDILQCNDEISRFDIVLSIEDVDFFSVKEVRFPDNIKVMYDPCSDFKNLESVKLPNSLEFIGDNAFYCCKKLKHIELPRTLKEIGSYAFANTNISSIVIPDSVTVIKDRAFSYCEKLKKVKMSNGIKRIEDFTFHECTSLEEVEFPDNLKEIGNYAFSDSNIQELILPNSLETIGENAFVDSSLTKVIIPGSVSNIAQGAFSHCGWLQDVKLEEGVETLEERCFSNCESLKKIDLPDSLKIIGENAFSKSGLEKIKIPDNVEEIEKYAFFECSGLKELELGKALKKIGAYSFKNCDIRYLNIPNNVEKIGAMAFASNSSLNTVRFEGIVHPRFKTQACPFANKRMEKVILNNKGKDITISDESVGIQFNEFGFYIVNNNNEYYFYDDNKLVKLSANELDKKYRNFTSLAHTVDVQLIYQWIKRNKFMPHHTIIENMPVMDIDLFYKNNNCNKWGELVKLAKMTSDSNKGTLFKLCYALGVFQESGSKRDKAIDYVKEHILGKLDEDAIHAKFDGLDTFNKPFDPMWADFFMKYYKDNPNFMAIEGVNLISSSYNNFAKVREAYPNKIVNTNRDADVLLPEHVVKACVSVSYSNVDEDNKNFADLMALYGYSQTQFEELQMLFNEGKKIAEKDLKLFISKDEAIDKEVTYHLLEKDNPLGAVVGNITNCCQVIGGAGASCVKYGMTMPNSKFMTFNYKKEILGQAWVWYDEKTGVVCLDNIEVPSRFLDKIKHSKELQQSLIECLKRMASNFISEMESHGLEVKKVTIGKGYNDIRDILNSNFKTDENVNRLSQYKEYSDAHDQYLIKKK